LLQKLLSGYFRKSLIQSMFHLIRNILYSERINIGFSILLMAMQTDLSGGDGDGTCCKTGYGRLETPRFYKLVEKNF